MTNLLVIGLGGTGTKILEDTVKMVQKTIPATEAHQIRFRAVDLAWEHEKGDYPTLLDIRFQHAKH